MKLRARKQFFVGDTSFGFSGKEASPTLALYISSPGLIGHITLFKSFSFMLKRAFEFGNALDAG